MEFPKDFSVLAVGQKFDLFETRPELKCQDGLVMELLKGGTFFIIIYMNKMTKGEEYLLSKAKIKVRLIHEGDFLLTLLSFNGYAEFEISFDPTIYPSNRMSDIHKSNLIQIVGIDSSNNIIKTLRMASTPIKLHKIWSGTWQKAYDIENYSTKYKRWVDDLDARYTVLQLWEQAEYIGQMGEQ